MNEARSFRVEAVILRHLDWGEADRLLTLYTREKGKIRAVAKGARRLKSRKAGHLEPFTRVTLQLARGREMLIVTQADTVDAYLPVRNDLVRTGYAAYVVELLERFTYEEGIADPSLYRLLTDTLQRIATLSEAWLAVRYYEVRLLDALGFRPQLFHCARCGAEVQAEDQFFSASAGGVLCRRCGAGLPGVWEVTVDALKYLRHFQRSSFGDAKRARPPMEIQRELESLMQRYFTFLLERELNTPGFIKQVNKQ